MTRVGPGAFAGSGLSESALRWPVRRCRERGGTRAASLAALGCPAPALVYCYCSDLDATGHRSGCGSLAWRLQLAHVDRLAEPLAAGLPPGAALWITAHHGMVDIGPDRRIDVALTPELDAGVVALAGEPRAWHVHTAPGAAVDVRDAWRELLADRALVLSRDEAAAAGWFGPVVVDRARERIGDVVVLAADDDLALVDSRRMDARALGLVGLHGSATAAEQVVPLLEARDD